MAIAVFPKQALWNKKKNKVLLFLAQRTVTSSLAANITTIPFNQISGLQPYVNANNAISQNVKTLCKQGRLKEAFNVLYLMDRQSILPDSSTYASLLQTCLNINALPESKLVHAHIILTGLQPDIFLGTKLVIMHAKCGCLVDARRFLDGMPERNVVSWTAMISAYARHGRGKQALTFFFQMQESGIQSNEFTFASVLPACSWLAAVEHGKEVHGNIIRNGFQSDTVVGNALVDMYAKCRSIVDARQVFEKMPERNIVSWNSLIAGYTQNGHADEALKLFQKMPERDVVSWTAMIAGYTQNKRYEEALKLFKQMKMTSVKPNSDTFASVLPACANLAALYEGKKVHEDMIRNGFQSDVFVGNALVDMYAKCGSIKDARILFEKMQRRDVVSWNAMIAGYAQCGHVVEALELFQKMPERNVVSWTTMITGYAQNGHFNETLKLFRHMQQRGVKPDSETLVSVLPACANLAALHKGKEVHDEIIRSGVQSDLFVGNALVDMYAKCGSIEDARKMFDKMPRRDTVSWTVIIIGYAMHGCGKEALQLFENMQNSGTKPDHVTFIGVLSACCHTGLVDYGWQYFHCMSKDYLIAPAVDHYCCMVDLLGRAGCLDDAYEFINKMPIKPNAAVWGSLLGACRIHTNIKLGEHVAERLFELDSKNAAHYVLLSNIYAAVGRWDDVENVRKMMRCRGVEKRPGCSWIEVGNKVYTFITGDRSYPQMQEIYAKLETLSGQDEGGRVCA
eukprot:Gb_28755 [translate_table: standard]